MELGDKMQEINFELFEKLENTTKRTEKMEILKQFGEAEKTLLKLALDPFLTYHIQKIEDNWFFPATLPKLGIKKGVDKRRSRNGCRIHLSLSFAIEKEMV